MKKRRIVKRRARCTRLRNSVTRLQHANVQAEVLTSIYARALDDEEGAHRKTRWLLIDQQQANGLLLDQNAALRHSLSRAELEVKVARTSLFVIGAVALAVLVTDLVLYLV